jgi:hypothetical protein
MDLMGLTRTESMGGKKYILVIVDDFSRFTWVLLLRENWMHLPKLKTCSKEFKISK